MENYQHQRNPLENEVFDNSDDWQDTKISPDLYIHQAMLKLQACLIAPDHKAGFLQYFLLVEHIAGICLAAKYITEEQIKSIESIQVEEQDDLVKRVKLANIKLGFLMKEIFSNKQLFKEIRADHPFIF
jgi:hypothetical protein